MSAPYNNTHSQGLLEFAQASQDGQGAEAFNPAQLLASIGPFLAQTAEARAAEAAALQGEEGPSIERSRVDASASSASNAISQVAQARLPAAEGARERKRRDPSEAAATSGEAPRRSTRRRVPTSRVQNTVHPEMVRSAHRDVNTVFTISSPEAKMRYFTTRPISAFQIKNSLIFWTLLGTDSSLTRIVEQLSYHEIVAQIQDLDTRYVRNHDALPMHDYYEALLTKLNLSYKALQAELVSIKQAQEQVGNHNAGLQNILSAQDHQLSELSATVQREQQEVVQYATRQLLQTLQNVVQQVGQESGMLSQALTASIGTTQILAWYFQHVEDNDARQYLEECCIQASNAQALSGKSIQDMHDSNAERRRVLEILLKRSAHLALINQLRAEGLLPN